MIQKRNWLERIVRRISGHQGDLDEQALNEALDYIDSYWQKLRFEQKTDSGTRIGLPHPYILPANNPDASFTFREQYYWDSYFTSLALVGTRHHALAEGMLDNLIYLFERFHFVPNANQMYQMSHSQPPLMTSLIRLIYEADNKDTMWLAKKMKVAQAEYESVWMNDTHPFWHKVHHGLSRYYDINVLHDLAEAESGWDMTPRFERKCLDFLPIDLNCLLYKYETDFAWAAAQLGDKQAHKKWLAAAHKRKQAIHHIMWHKRRGFYFDYNYNKNDFGDTWSLAGFFPLWAGVATKEQAARMVKHLDKFEFVGGLVTTTKPLIDMGIFGSLKTQWAYPNGWAPLHWIVVQGLRDYGYNKTAKRITEKWLRTNLVWYERHGEFLEKYNVVRPTKHPIEGVYPSQSGFGWTNAVFVALTRQLTEDASDEEILA